MTILNRNSKRTGFKARKTKLSRLYHTKDIERRDTIKKLYLSGMTADDVGRVAGIARRTVYYHLDPLTPEEIGEHYKNLAIRQRAAKLPK